MAMEAPEQLTKALVLFHDLPPGDWRIPSRSTGISRRARIDSTIA
ncbi:hypothetical protein U1769_15485 [Sphingomonas sp. ZT3P38]